ncbi:MAG: nicotinate-nucleotide adenylyltransferase [Alphaproteobacteria bacterium]
MKPRRRPRYRPIRLSAQPVDPPDVPRRRRHRRVGLLGGSFNPAHEGHLHISLIALKTFGLDELWWLVAPQNPLKSAAEMAPFAQRVEGARRMAHGHRIRICTIEDELGLRYTADTLAALKRRFRGNHFLWLMGADNLPSFTRWHRWAEIYRAVPVAVFDRHPYAAQVHAAVPSLRFAEYRIPERQSRRLVGMTPPAWVFLHIPLHAASASAIRAARRAAAPRRKAS